MYVILSLYFSTFTGNGMYMCIYITELMDT